MRYFEDMEVGETAELGNHTFTAESIKRFARAFDPQPFHVDEDAAATSLFGGLCASGWHTAAVCIRLISDYRLRNTDGETAADDHPGIGPSPGFDDLKWLKPVYAGQTIAFTTTVTGLRASRSRPEWGILTSLNEGRGQDGELVFSFVGHLFVPRRPQNQFQSGAAG